MPPANQSNDRMNDIAESMAALNVKIESMADGMAHFRTAFERRSDGLERELNKVTQMLQGADGGSGLIVRVDRLEQEQIRQSSRITDEKHSRTYWIRWAFGLAAGAVVSVVAGVVVAWVKFKG